MSESPPIFLSYARVDGEFCLRLATDLKEAGIRVWMDQLDITPGERWDDEIEHAIHRADTMLVVLSPASIGSKNVRDEINFALDQNDAIVPVLYQACEIPFRLLRVQHIDFTGDYRQALARLIERLSGGPVTPQPATHTAKPAGTVRQRAVYGVAVFVVIAAIAIAVLWFRGNGGVATLDVGADRTLVASGDNGRVSLDPGTVLSDGSRIESYTWQLDGRPAGTTRAANLALAPGRHRVTLTAVNERGKTFSDSVEINVITADQMAIVRALLDSADSNIELATRQFNSSYLAEGVSSAYAALQEVSRIDPFNADAARQLQRIADLYAAEARKRADAGRVTEAIALVDQGLQVRPQDTALQKLKRTLEP